MECIELNRVPINTYGHLDYKKKGILWTDRRKAVWVVRNFSNNEELQNEGTQNKDKLRKDAFTKRAGRNGYQAAQLR